MRTPLRIKALFGHKNWLTLALNDIKTVNGFVITNVPRADRSNSYLTKKRRVVEELFKGNFRNVTLSLPIAKSRLHYKSIANYHRARGKCAHARKDVNLSRCKTGV
jgi:hypothetical protein